MKTTIVTIVLILLAYVAIQGYYVLKGQPKLFLGHAIFTHYWADRKLNWPIGETVTYYVRPTDERFAEGWPPYNDITVDRFFYKKTKKVYLNEDV